MPRYLYRPKDNRTPVNDPILGHLDYDSVYDDPRCADDPRFVEIKEEKPGKPAKGSDDKTAADKAPEAGDPAGASK